MRLFSLFAILIASQAFGQEIVTEFDGRTVTPMYRRIIRPDGTTLHEARGVWRANGYGYLAEITESDVRLFHLTDKVAWKVEGMPVSELRFASVEEGKLALISTGEHKPPYAVERIEAFPEIARPKVWTPKLLYAAFAETMDENYVFFKERKFDWKKRRRAIEARIHDGLSDAQLFELLVATLEGLEDGHVQLGATIDGEPRRPMFGMSETEKRGVEVYENQSKFTDFEPFLNDRIQKFETAIAQNLLRGNPNQVCNQLTYGVMKGNVGYLHIAGMSDFSDTESTTDQLREINEAIPRILHELQDTKSLVIDVSTNGGGADEFSVAIASHFTDKRRLAFVKGPRNYPRVRHSVFVQPAAGDGPSYRKPIYLVINDVTVSAAEIFVLCMKDLPNVTLIGKKTRGALSDVLPKTLPNGWAFGLSNEVYLDSKGTCYEPIGIPPKIELEVIDPTQPDLGHARAIREIAELE